MQFHTHSIPRTLRAFASGSFFLATCLAGVSLTAQDEAIEGAATSETPANEPEQLDQTVVDAAQPAPAPRPTAPTPRASPPPAEQPSPATEPIIIDDESPVAYGEIESSSALFGATPILEIPFSVGVIDQEIILERRAFTVEDALLYEPSVTSGASAGFYNRSDFSIRGFGWDTYQSYRTDGLPMVQLVEPAIDDKERLEVLKGPAGLRFGFVPPGGVINYIRKRPTQDLYRSVSTDIDTFGSFYSQVDISDTIHYGNGAGSYLPDSSKNPWSKNPTAKAPLEDGPSVGYRFVIAGDKFEDFRDNVDGDRIFGSSFIEWKPNDDISIWTSISGQNRERKGFGGVLISDTGVIHDTGVNTNNMQSWGHNRQEVLDFAIGADIDLNDSWKIRTSTNYGESDRSGYQSWPGPVFADGSFVEFEWLIGEQSWDYWSHHTHIEGEFYTGPIKHELVVGGEYRFVESSRSPQPRGSNIVGVNNTYNLQYLPWIGADPQGNIPFYEYSETSFFATDTIEFTEWLSVLGGVRWSELEGTNIDQFTGATSTDYKDDVISPTAAIMIEPIEDVHTYVSYTQGMTQGGVAPFNAANALEQLPPLESRQLEVGLKAELLEDNLYAEFAYFNIEQDLEFLGNNLIYTQDGLRVHEGFEFNLRGRLTQNLNAGVSAMILDAVQQDTGNPLQDGCRPDNVPDYKATAWAEWEVPALEGLALSLNTVFVGSRFGDAFEQFEMDEYALLNAGVRYRFQTETGKQITLRAYVENITDERYFTYGYYSPGYNGQLDYGAPVHATFSAQIEF